MALLQTTRMPMRWRPTRSVASMLRRRRSLATLVPIRGASGAIGRATSSPRRTAFGHARDTGENLDALAPAPVKVIVLAPLRRCIGSSSRGIDDADYDAVRGVL